jgi:hypothetical protein
VDVMHIMVLVLLAAMMVPLSLLGYAGWTRYKRHQLRRSARY